MARYNGRMNASTPPFAGLTPDTLLTALESVGLAVSGHLLALNSYENRVYQIGIDDGPPLVAKFYRPARWSDEQILEEHGFVAELAAREIPVVAPLELEGRTLHHHGGFRFAVFPRRGGRAPELDRPDTLQWLGRFLGRIHALGAAAPYRERPALTGETFGTEPLSYLRQCAFIPPDLRDVYFGVAEQALDGVRRCYERAGTVSTLRLHGDCHASNVLWTDAGPHFVDLDDARQGPAVQDLWMLAADDAGFDALVEGYEQFRPLDPAERAFVPALRAMRQVHHAGWIASRWHDPAFPAAFPFAAEARWWEQHVADLHDAADAL